MKREFAGLLRTVLSPLSVKAYRLQRPKRSKPPFVIYQEIIRVPDSNLQMNAELAEAGYQLDVYAPKCDATVNQVLEVLRGLHGYRDGQKIHLVLLDSERESYESDTELYRFSFDLTVHFYS